MTFFSLNYLCPVIQLRQPSLASRHKSGRPKLIYWVWKNKLPAWLIFAILGIADFAYALEITNPISPVSSFPQLIDRIASALRTIVMPLAIAAIIFVGFKFVNAAASGNQAELTKAKTMLWWVLIGTAIVIGASVLAQAVVNFASGLNS